MLVDISMITFNYMRTNHLSQEYNKGPNPAGKIASGLGPFHFL